MLINRTARTTSVGLAAAAALVLLVAGCTASGTSAAPATVTVSSTAGPTAASPAAAPAQSTSASETSSTATTPHASTTQIPGSTTPDSSAASPRSPRPVPTSSALPADTAIIAGPVTVTASPPFGSTDLSPAVPLRISVTHARISALTVTNAAGKVVKGAFSADRGSWSVSESLGYGNTYTAAGTATGADGKATRIGGTFGTLTPASTVRTTISPGDGKKVGVATSVIVAFGVTPLDRVAAAKTISVTTTPKVTGAWVWIQHDDRRWALDFRTKGYWPANTKVHVQANVYGLKFADGAYGAGDVTSDFTIGRNQVVKADVNSHDLLVFRDEKKVASYPASFGKGDTPDKITRSGIHVVNDMFPTKLMSNPKYGYVNVLERWAVRISDNGEFIHANPKTVKDQGRTNVSHGCVNLSAASAAAYYKSTLLGDPVEVTGTKINLSPADGDLFDWAYTWPQWNNMAVKPN